MRKLLHRLKPDICCRFSPAVVEASAAWSRAERAATLRHHSAAFTTTRRPRYHRVADDADARVTEPTFDVEDAEEVKKPPPRPRSSSENKKSKRFPSRWDSNLKLIDHEGPDRCVADVTCSNPKPAIGPGADCSRSSFRV